MAEPTEREVRVREHFEGNLAHSHCPAKDDVLDLLDTLIDQRATIEFQRKVLAALHANLVRLAQATAV